MTTTPQIIDEAENLVRRFAAEMTAVRGHECLCCYVARQLDEHSCDGTHRHALRYRDAAAPHASALLERLRRVGACCCDCELFMNGYRLHPRLIPPACDGDAMQEDPRAQLPACAGVRRGSVQPCAN
jgi:hypothetical protein